MINEMGFKFNVCDVERNIFEKSASKELKERDLEMIAGGKMNNKFLASSLTALSLLTSTGIVASAKAEVVNSQTASVSNSQRLEQNSQEIQYFTKQQVIEDIDYVMDTIKKNHVGCVNRIPDEVLKQKEIEIQNLSESTSSVEEWRIISRILAKFHDAHTYVLAPEFLYHKRLPLDIENVDNKFFCKSGEFNGAEIIEINGIKISDIYENFKLHYSHEIDEWVHVNFFRCLPFTQSNLALAGIDTFKPIEVSFKTDKGIAKQKFEFIKVENKFTKAVPFASYKIDKDDGVGIFTLNECNFNKEYCDTVDSFFADVAKNNIKNVVVDLRKNTGGNSDVMFYFAKYLKNLESATNQKIEIRTSKGVETFGGKTFTSEDLKTFKFDKNLFDGKIFVLTSNLTFSSAMLFVQYFSDNNLATIVGEVPGNSPTSYGDISGHGYTTKNSRLKFCTTYKKFYRVDSTKDPDRIIPDVQVSAKDALNKAYELIKSES